ncbi:hypothetical protein llap_9269 [Limosa lapponica baueri]|uniref:Uncharacterized protein n=1 Tax=Limosa lapponica baueri TaxID=1758121 RepID=A0A2I0U332_LIMLA|nr:hypothetical protein llap_9269 [Limosa lapponica baueri]
MKNRGIKIHKRSGTFSPKPGLATTDTRVTCAVASIRKLNMMKTWVKYIPTFPCHRSGWKSTATRKGHPCSSVRQEVKCRYLSSPCEEVSVADCCWQRRDVQQEMVEKTFPDSKTRRRHIGVTTCMPCARLAVQFPWVERPDEESVEKTDIAGRLRGLENDAGKGDEELGGGFWSGQKYGIHLDPSSVNQDMKLTVHDKFLGHCAAFMSTYSFFNVHNNKEEVTEPLYGHGLRDEKAPLPFRALGFGKLQYCIQPEAKAGTAMAAMGCHQGVNPNAHHQKVAKMQIVSEDIEKMQH